MKKPININIKNTSRDKDLHSGERIVTLEEFEKFNLKKYSQTDKYIKEFNSVLDVGCGAGYGTEYLRKRGYRVLGVDDSFDTIEYARLQNKKTIFKTFDMCNISLYPTNVTTNNIDVITAFDFLNSFTDPTVAMCNLAKFRSKYILGTIKEKKTNEWELCSIKIKDMNKMILAIGYEIVEYSELDNKDVFFAIEKTNEINKKVFYPQNKCIRPKTNVKKFIDTISSVPIITSNKKKVLILGSGNSALDIKHIDTKGWHVLAINNAWQLNKWDSLIYPTDFYKLPMGDDIKNKQLIDFNEYIVTCGKYGLQKHRGDSMIFNAAYYAMSMSPGIIAFLGCDLYYPPGEQTHFYGKGNPDPLRLGIDNLLGFLYRLKEKARQNNIELYNLSKEEKSMLPFKRINVSKRKKAIFVSFNKPFLKYAEALISSFYRHKNDDYDFVCFTVGVDKKELKSLGYPWNNEKIKIYNQNIKFESKEKEAYYMNSMRFCLYESKLKNYDFVYMSDADMICNGKMKEAETEMIGKDIGMIFTGKLDNRKKVRACSIAVDVNDKTKMFFNEYKKNLDLLYGNNEWYNDQLAIYKTLIENKFSYSMKRLESNKYCAFYKKYNGLFIATAAEDKLKGNYYTELFINEQKMIEENRK